jgi:hypothetical protein
MWPFGLSEEQKQKAAELREQYKGDPDIKVLDSGRVIVFSRTWTEKELRELIREEIAKSKD